MNQKQIDHAIDASATLLNDIAIGIDLVFDVPNVNAAEVKDMLQRLRDLREVLLPEWGD